MRSSPPRWDPLRGRPGVSDSLSGRRGAARSRRLLRARYVYGAMDENRPHARSPCHAITAPWRDPRRTRGVLLPRQKCRSVSAAGFAAARLDVVPSAAAVLGRFVLFSIRVF